MQLPNALWLSIIAAVTMVINQVYPDALWAPVALAALLAVGKWVEVNVVAPPPVPQSDLGGPAPQQDSKIKRWLIG